MTMYDVPTGRTVWESPDLLGGAISAADAVIDGETEPIMSPWEARVRGVSVDRRVLAVRDAATRRIRWQSAALAGTPLAASRGRVLVVSGGLLRCLRQGTLRGYNDVLNG